MEIKLKNLQQIKCKKEVVLVLPYFQGGEIHVVKEEIKKEVDKFSETLASLKENEIRFVISDQKKIVFLNVGGKEKWNQRKFLLNLRKIVRFLKENNIQKATLLLEEIIPRGVNLNNLAKQISENILLADYEFTRYKKEPKEGWTKIRAIEISWPNPQKYQKDFSQGGVIGQAINSARDISNIPGGEMTPEKLAVFSLKTLKNLNNIQTEVFDKKKLEKLGMGGILGVSQGSFQKPKLIILKYFGKKRDRKFDLAFVGKGITFDTGGLNVKPSDSMLTMHMDMSGGAAVLGAMLAISQIKVPLNIVALIPAAENMPSGQAYRPGDLLKSYDGKTIEVINTDAEGRIILADALSYAVKNFKPKMVVDVATLTGAAVAALGQRAIGLFTNLPKMENILRQLGEDSGDYVWPLPCWEEYEEEIKGIFGDIANVGKTKYGGAITAALFLKNFVEDLPWIHLDIAPTMVSIENQGLAQGATGTGVRYLIKLAQEFQDIEERL